MVPGNQEQPQTQGEGISESPGYIKGSFTMPAQIQARNHSLDFLYKAQATLGLGIPA